MKFGTFCSTSLIAISMVTASAEAVSVCDEINQAYNEVRNHPASVRDWMVRVFRIMALVDDLRLNTNDTRTGAIENMHERCKIIVRNQNTAPTEKEIIAREWGAFIMTFRRSSGFRSNGNVVPVRFDVPPWGSETSTWQRWPRLRLVQSEAETLASPPLPPLRGAPIVKVFPKENLGQERILRLRVLLADFNVTQGKSTLVGNQHTADVLFVNRGRVSQQQVLKVANALHDVGVDIKSIQQREAGPGQFQIGTLAPGGRQVFAGSAPLDLGALASLQGNEFWKAAFNGQAWCDQGVGRTRQCRIGNDGRPIP